MKILPLAAASVLAICITPLFWRGEAIEEPRLLIEQTNERLPMLTNDNPAYGLLLLIAAAAK